MFTYLDIRTSLVFLIEKSHDNRCVAYWKGEGTWSYLAPFFRSSLTYFRVPWALCIEVDQMTQVLKEGIFTEKKMKPQTLTNHWIIDLFFVTCMFLNISVTYKCSLVKFLLVSIVVATPYDSSDMPSYLVRDTAWKLDVVSFLQQTRIKWKMTSFFETKVSVTYPPRNLT